MEKNEKTLDFSQFSHFFVAIITISNAGKSRAV